MDLPSQELLQNYAAGDAAAARELYDRYARRLIGVARRMLADKLAQRIDPEDVVQSAYRSFFVRAREGEYTLRESGDLWRLLIAVTRHKLLHQVEKQTAAKRSPLREEFAAESQNEEPSVEEVAAVSDELAAILSELPRDDRRLLELRLREESVEAIAAELGISARTARRRLLELRRQFERRLGADVERLARSPAPAIDPVAQLDYREFRLEQMIGAGGFGKVYKATWLPRGQTVAVKSLRKQVLLDHRAVQNFLLEARLLAPLEHPGIIRSHGLGRTPAGGYFLALDWHSGGDLSHCPPLTPREIARFIAEAADAIAHAHERGVIHCDLKPSNLLLSTDRRVIVTDFGFAHALQRDASVARIGGTLGFAAPELWRVSSPTAACDLFSLGKILRFLLQRAIVTSEEVDLAAELERLAESCAAEEPRDRTPLLHKLRRELNPSEIEDA
jgi:RNA polymerase sigma factor (sigma-70 family)